MKKAIEGFLRALFVRDHVFGHPIIHPSSFVFSSARVIGDVTISEGVIVAPGASIRADEEGPFFIGKGTNIQDGAIIHALKGKHEIVGGKLYAVYIGSHCSVTHGVKIHGPVVIGKKTCLSFGATIHHATVGDRCFVDMNAVVRYVKIPPRKFVAATMVVETQEVADNLPDVTEEHLKFNREVVDVNKEELRAKYAERRKMKNVFFRLLYCWKKHRIING